MFWFFLLGKMGKRSRPSGLLLYPPVTFYVIKTLQILSAGIVAGIMFYFITHLNKLHYSLPWMFFFVRILPCRSRWPSSEFAASSDTNVHQKASRRCCHNSGFFDPFVRLDLHARCFAILRAYSQWLFVCCLGYWLWLACQCHERNNYKTLHCYILGQ
jgi:hypothetical protein